MKILKKRKNERIIYISAMRWNVKKSTWIEDKKAIKLFVSKKVPKSEDCNIINSYNKYTRLACEGKL